jgi:hypothetical protein
MVSLETALLIAGLLHFTLLLAGFSAPRVLNWSIELRKVNSLTRQLVLVHGGFIVLTIIAFGAMTLAGGAELLGGTRTALLLTGFIALFWGARLVVQITYFEAGPWLTTIWRKLGYRALYVVFAYLTCVYAWAAWRNVALLTGS